jgi:hypothetical protein
MPFEPNPPRKWVFYTALLLGMAAIVMHFFAVLGPAEAVEGLRAVYAFWMMAAAWLLLLAAAILKQL